METDEGKRYVRLDCDDGSSYKYYLKDKLLWKEDLSDPENPLKLNEFCWTPPRIIRDYRKQEGYSEDVSPWVIYPIDGAIIYFPSIKDYSTREPVKWVAEDLGEKCRWTTEHGDDLLLDNSYRQWILRDHPDAVEWAG